MADLLKQLKRRRLALGLRQKDMLLRAGISRQQYQRLETQGNPRLSTLELIASGLESDILLVPKDKRAAVMALISAEHETLETPAPDQLSDDPWRGLLGDDDG